MIMKLLRSIFITLNNIIPINLCMFYIISWRVTVYQQLTTILVLVTILYINNSNELHLSTDDTLEGWSTYKKSISQKVNSQMNNNGEQNYWIETLVFADHTVMNRFSNKTIAEDYVKTLMRMTDELFHHPSLGVNMSLVVQDIIWVSEAETKHTTYSPHFTKSSYCISPLSQMCRMQYSCTLAEDSGFFSAYPIAHEIMHRTQKFTCLQDFPIFKQEYMSFDLPGWQWSLDQQCFVISGSNISQHCPGVGEYACQELWCSMTGSKDHCDKMLNHGLLDGTPCGEKKECFHGECIDLNPQKLEINQRSNQYTSWSACSRTNGIGTRYRTRRCFNRNQNKCEFNDNESMFEYELCGKNTDEEHLKSIDYREKQCSRFDQFKLRGIYHKWLPYIYSQRPCSLSCYSLQSGQILDASMSVRDSTPCTYDNPDARCIQSVCINFDCFGQVNGTARRDQCGVCQGNNSTCTFIQHRIQRVLPLNEEYRMLYVIPRYARHLKISKNYGNHVLGLFDMQHFQFFLKGDELELDTKLRRVYFATEFVFDPGNPMSKSADSFIQIQTKGTIYGDVAIQARNLNIHENLDPLDVEISYVLPLSNDH
ncbi:ADAMTS14 peptidase (M12 family) [Schistosoma mansoni]|uniref:ADAMTS14 peptidase (M12 family) n=1 Tax=Schistosoma mansoni TaxID=6183 RepID=UPI00022DC847|nr:ADAMTS14 peptidase (M12 family) [Schistosoma mansoni]|eukprot:XP_018652693.1 ADAMTS14 peptidase (M12 family) [Schistosoma mansoni]